MEYKILSDESGSRLQDEINEYLKEGWEPQGGICYSTGHFFYQALIKKSNA